MKTIIVTILLSSFFLLTNSGVAQSYTKESKSCGKCKKEVSVNSRVGMTCPHCGVEWGRENKTTDYSGYNSFNNKTIAVTNTNCNVRSYGSKNAEILDKLSAVTPLTILAIDGDWLKVSYSYYEIGYGIYSGKGWVHRSVVD
jgi:hypothetical protein